MPNDTAKFTRSLPAASDFSQALDESSYVPVPDGWLVAVTDVVKSREAIAAGKYKAVNMAGVAMISAAMNALGTQEVPFIFGGDGAALIIAPGEREAVATSLSKTAVFAGEELGLELRLAIVPVSRVRADGLDIRVKPVRISDALNNFAFTGGGLSHAEDLMKGGEYLLEKAPAGQRPDLEGLSCRWTPISSPGKNVVSLILERAESETADRFARTVQQLMQLAGLEGDAASPMPRQGPRFTWPPPGLDMEARASRGDKPLAAQKRLLYLITAIAWLLDKTGIPLGGFDPKRYRRYTALNTDFRKVQDGLRMTVSLDDAGLAALKGRLEELRLAGRVRYGLCVQDSAVLTCYVPSLTSDSHFHFLDGAGGGYAEAASNMAA